MQLGELFRKIYCGISNLCYSPRVRAKLTRSPAGFILISIFAFCSPLFVHLQMRTYSDFPVKFVRPSADLLLWNCVQPKQSREAEPEGDRSHGEQDPKSGNE